MKKFLAMALAAVLALSLVACGGGDSSDSASENTSTVSSESVVDDSLDKVLDSGELVVAISPDFAPSDFKDPNTGEVMGIDVVVANYIADYIGEKYDKDITLKIEEMQFKACIAAVDTQRVDFSVNGYGKTEERAANYYMTAPYNLDEDENSFQGVLMLAEDAPNYTKKEDFTGKKLAAQLSSLQEGFVKNQLQADGIDVELVNIDNIELGLQDLLMGRVDGLCTTSETGSVFIERNKETRLAMAPFHFDYKSEGTVALLNKSSVALGKEIDEAINAMNEDPEIDFIELREEYTKKAMDLGLAIG